MILRRGSKGPKVVKLQTLLKIKADGDFGQSTEKAVIEFQKKNKLVADGIVGIKTWNALEKNLKPISKNSEELINLINSAKITRKIKRLIFHCTATSQSATVASIQKYWKEKLGWKSPGYHIIVKPDGSWTQLTDFNAISNGVTGYNSDSINVSYIGGIDAKGKAIDNRTPQQKEIFEIIYYAFKEKLPNITFHGHNEFANKACPSFNVKTWIASLTKL